VLSAFVALALASLIPQSLISSTAKSRDFSFRSSGPVFCNTDKTSSISRTGPIPFPTGCVPSV